MLKHMFLLSTADLILISDALDIINPDSKKAKDRAVKLAILFRNKIPEERL